MAVAPRYMRNIRALSEDECTLLGNKRVVVAGCGGLGGYVIEVLARIGVGTLEVVDGDVFEESNLNRQLLSTEELLGTPKAEAAALRVSQINSATKVVVHNLFLCEQNVRDMVRGADCVVDCLDNVEARFWLAHACQEEGIPLVYGAIAGWYGQVCTVYPGDVSFVTVYGAVEGQGVQKQEGNLPFTASATASFQAAETVKVLIGRGEVLRNRLLMIDTLSGCAEEMELFG